MDEWKDKESVAHTHTGILFILKKEENTVAICNNAEILEGILSSEIR